MVLQAIEHLRRDADDTERLLADLLQALNAIVESNTESTPTRKAVTQSRKELTYVKLLQLRSVEQNELTIIADSQYKVSANLQSTRSAAATFRHDVYRIERLLVPTLRLSLSSPL